MIENEKDFKEILKVLNEEGLLSKIILVGSWCLLFYQNIFDNLEYTLRTFDVDFYVPDIKSFREKSGVIKAFKAINYDIIHDSLTYKSTFLSPDGLELEFITGLKRNYLSLVRLGNTEIYAETLPYVDIFTHSFIEMNFEGMTIKVASPISYVFQKLLIHKDRKLDKKESDIASIKYVLSGIALSKNYKKEMKNVFNSLPIKWKKKIIQNAEDIQIDLSIYIC